MKLLVTYSHGYNAQMAQEIGSLGNLILTLEKTYWQVDMTLDQFMAKWNRPMQVYPIQEKTAPDSFGCDFLVIITNRGSFQTR